MYINTTVSSWKYQFVVPEAHITSKKSRLKVYDHKNVYLKDESNFEIELQNPTNSKYLAKIYVNGKSISAGGIIINANSRTYLERFIAENAKFVFKTFEVDDVKETIEARERNGLVKIEFYPERIDLTTPFYYNTYTYTNTNDIIGGNILRSTSYYSSAPIEKSLKRRVTLNESKATLDQVETGRVEKGEKSEQKFIEGSGDFSIFPSYVYEFQILPESQKAIEANEIRNYCGECGVRIKKSNWKYCPNCGEKL
jgi:hypothetical protein